MPLPFPPGLDRRGERRPSGAQVGCSRGGRPRARELDGWAGGPATEGGVRMRDDRDFPSREPGEAGSTPPPGPRMSRLRLLMAGAAGAVSAAGAGPLAAEAEAAPVRVRFFTNHELALVNALAEVIWPTDDLGPGARAAGVGFYIDGQLDG